MAIIGSYDGHLTAFDLSNGNQVWNSVVAQHIGASPACTEEYVYISVEFSEPDAAGGVCKVKVDNGESVWCDYTMLAHSHSSPAIDLDLNIVVAGSNDGKLHVYRETDGFKLAEYKLYDEEVADDEAGGLADVKGAILLWKGVAIFGSWAGAVHSADLNEFVGNQIFGSQFVMRTKRKRHWEDDAAAYERLIYMSSVAVDPETDLLYIGGDDGYVYCIDFKTGEEVWDYATEGFVLSSPVSEQNGKIEGSSI